MTTDKIPEAMQRIAFGARPLPSPLGRKESGRQLRGTASPGLSDETVTHVVAAKGHENTAKSGIPASTEVIAAKTAGKIDTTPLAMRFKNK
jgi:hypothetical protein